MTDPHRLNAPFSSDAVRDDRPPYRIMRKGSRYNILGPHGRIFSKYKSASTVGPRWEELTHTAWPYESSAYERGHRLWELGLIERKQVGARQITVGAVRENSELESSSEQNPDVDAHAATEVPTLVIVTPLALLALPAPRLNVKAHEQVMQALRRDPALIFTPRAQQALRDEVLYHRAHARWAQHILNLLARFERHQRRRRPAPVDPVAVTQKHIAWQEQQISMAAIASLSC